MPPILLFTGSAGPGIATAAAGLALGIAAQGQRTLLLSLGSAAGLGALLDVQLSAQVTSVAPDLDVLVPDPAAELTELWARMSGQMPEALRRLSADELPLLPGAGALFGLARLAGLRSDYSRIIVDAGSHDVLLTTLGLPDISRWLLRLLVGLDRGPGHSRSSVASALLPAGLLPSAALEQVQELRMRLEQARAELIDPQIACACYVLRPDAPGLAEARLAVPAIQLHGMAVASIAVGPLAPGGDVPDEAAAAWPTRPWVPFPAPSSEGSAGLSALAHALAVCDLEEAPAPAIRERYQGQPALVVELPGLPKGALGLTLSTDELIVRIGPYRRYILLPDALRGSPGIRATREGDLLVVRRRE